VKRISATVIFTYDAEKIIREDTQEILCRIAAAIQRGDNSNEIHVPATENLAALDIKWGMRHVVSFPEIPQDEYEKFKAWQNSYQELCDKLNVGIISQTEFAIRAFSFGFSEKEIEAEAKRILENRVPALTAKT
jgi:hypothetical protein